MLGIQSQSTVFTPSASLEYLVSFCLFFQGGNFNQQKFAALFFFVFPVQVAYVAGHDSFGAAVCRTIHTHKAQI